jgi:hypothetical protein
MANTLCHHVRMKGLPQGPGGAPRGAALRLTFMTAACGGCACACVLALPKKTPLPKTKESRQVRNTTRGEGRTTGRWGGTMGRWDDGKGRWGDGKRGEQHKGRKTEKHANILIHFRNILGCVIRRRDGSDHVENAPVPTSDAQTQRRAALGWRVWWKRRKAACCWRCGSTWPTRVTCSGRWPTLSWTPSSWTLLA